MAFDSLFESGPPELDFTKRGGSGATLVEVPDDNDEVVDGASPLFATVVILDVVVDDAVGVADAVGNDGSVVVAEVDDGVVDVVVAAVVEGVTAGTVPLVLSVAS